MFHVNNPLSIGIHTIAIYVPGITVNTYTFLNMTIQETISATVLASTGSTGSTGSIGITGSTGSTGPVASTAPTASILASGVRS